MTIVNAALMLFFAAVMAPFTALAPGVGVVVVSLLSGILFLLLFKRTSDQKAIRRVRDQMRASVLEIRLFQHDLGVVFRAQGRVLLETLVYLRYSLAPVVFICAPLIIIVIHCNLYFGYRPLREGEAAIVSARLKRNISTMDESVRLTPPEGIEVETPPVFIRPLNRIEWRIRAREAGVHKLVLSLGGSSFEKEIAAGEGLRRLSPVRVSGGFLKLPANPAERPLPPDAPLEYVKVSYPARADAFFGWGAHWVVPFFVLTLVFGFAFKGIMKVEI